MCTHFKAPIALGNSFNVERQYSLIKSNIFHQYTLPMNPIVFLEVFIKRINFVTTLMKMLMKQSSKQNANEAEDKMDIDENPDADIHETEEVSDTLLIENSNIFKLNYIKKMKSLLM